MPFGPRCRAAHSCCEIYDGGRGFVKSLIVMDLPRTDSNNKFILEGPMRSKGFVMTLAALLLASIFSHKSQAQVASRGDLKEIAAEAYIFAYPMVVMATAREIMTSVPRSSTTKAPVNSVAKQRVIPNENSNQIYPETDTLASLAWLDLSQEPIVLSFPNAGQRFISFSLISAWGEVFAAPGSRTLGNQKRDVVITGPGFKGTLPPTMQRIVAPTNSVWMVGRTQVNGAGDYDRVYGYQDKFKATPLSYFNKKTAPPLPVTFNIDVDHRTPILEQVDNLDARVFFATFAAELKQNPPAQTDGKIISKMAALGIFPDKEFDYDRLPASVREALNSGYFAGQEKFASFQRGTPNLRVVNGWGHPILAGRYGTNYQARALMTKLGLATSAPQDLALAQALVDGRGERLNGSFKYVLKFPKGTTPPVKGFWSLSLYNTRKFFAANSANKFAIHSRDELVKNPDGSIEIYIQSISPGKKLESNWLPSPTGEDFSLVTRFYWPKPSVLDGSWKMPSLEKVPEFKNLSDNLY
ncbi:DUF1254 domain-containing protein [Bdellovibrio sp. HCB209]|uniref:DUF1254 domain-containing protein n=1 Tax=Bdellovibrio sp. HCB209 TaxID=3394354 RepID=UPI0039B5B2A7